MRILAIETSCDETAAAVLADDGRRIQILSEVVSSQNELHERYGGIVPELAAREHLTNLPIVVDSALRAAGLDYGELDLLAVTRGPGLHGCLLMGVNFARGLSMARKLPLLGINHIEAHLFSPWIEVEGPSFPFLSLVVSGGHTEIHLVEDLNRYTLIARTRDDAAGEAFDKSANLLGFTYPGGARLANAADKFLAGSRTPRSGLALPKVMCGERDFSFSGLKTAIQLLLARHKELCATEEGRCELSAVIQCAIVDILESRVRDAATLTGVGTVAVAGGVSANSALRTRISQLPGMRVLFPRPEHCMDNATMIGFLALHKYRRGARDAGECSALSRWPVEQVHGQ